MSLPERELGSQKTNVMGGSMTNSFNPAEPADPASVLQLESLAVRILILIEARSLYQLSQSRRLNQAYFSAESKFSAGPGEKTSSPAMPPKVSPAGALTPAAINQSASQWKKLVPLDPNLQAALLHVFIRKY